MRVGPKFGVVMAGPVWRHCTPLQPGPCNGAGFARTITFVTRIDVQPELKPFQVATWSEVPDRTPVGAMVEGIDLVIIRDGEAHSVLYGRCLHRGALLADGHVDGGNLLCGLHGWDYCIETGVSAYNNAEVLEKFTSWIEGDALFVDGREVEAFEMRHPQPYDPDVYQGYY